MIVKNLYLVKGIKYYPSYQGDSGEETVNLLIPADSSESAKASAENTGAIDEISCVQHLYEVLEGCGCGKNGVWEVTDGFDTETIYKI